MAPSVYIHKCMSVEPAYNEHSTTFTRQWPQKRTKRMLFSNYTISVIHQVAVFVFDNIIILLCRLFISQMKTQQCEGM